MRTSKAENRYGKIVEIFGFYGDDESVEFREQPNGFEFLIAGRGTKAAGLYENWRDDFADKYTPGAYIGSVVISGSKNRNTKRE